MQFKTIKYILGLKADFLFEELEIIKTVLQKAVNCGTLDGQWKGDHHLDKFATIKNVDQFYQGIVKSEANLAGMAEKISARSAPQAKRAVLKRIGNFSWW